MSNDLEIELDINDDDESKKDLSAEAESIAEKIGDLAEEAIANHWEGIKEAWGSDDKYGFGFRVDMRKDKRKKGVVGVSLKLTYMKREEGVYDDWVEGVGDSEVTEDMNFSFSDEE